MSRPRKYAEELLERGVRLALESGRPIARVGRRSAATWARAALPASVIQPMIETVTMRSTPARLRLVGSVPSGARAGRRSPLVVDRCVVGVVELGDGASEATGAARLI
jgi:transposase